MTTDTITYWPELHPDLGLVWRTSDGGNFELEWHAQLYAVRGCPQTTADECAFVAERAAAAGGPGLPPCPIHATNRCPACGSDDLQLWADDGEADAADWWECTRCRIGGAVVAGQLVRNARPAR